MELKELEELFKVLDVVCRARFADNPAYLAATDRCTHYTAQPAGPEITKEGRIDDGNLLIADTTEGLFDQLPEGESFWFGRCTFDGQLYSDLQVLYSEGRAELHWTNEPWNGSDGEAIALLEGRRTHIVLRCVVPPVEGDVMYLRREGTGQVITVQVGHVTSVPTSWTTGPVWALSVRDPQII